MNRVHKVVGMGGWKTWSGILGKVAVLIGTEFFGVPAGDALTVIFDKVSELLIIVGVAHKIEKASK